jgi:predicted transcriptional regulator
MGKATSVSVRLDPGLNDRLAAIATALDRPKTWVIEQAVEALVATQEWQLAAIDKGCARPTLAASCRMRMWSNG